MSTVIRKWRPLHVLIVVVFGGLAWVPAHAAEAGLYGAFWAADDAGQSAGAGARLKVGLTRLVGFEIRAGFFPDLETGGQELEMLPLEAGLVIDVDRRGPLNPYLGGGASYYQVSGPFRRSDGEVGWYAVLGAEVGDVTGMAVFLEAIYRGGEVTVRPEGMSLPMPAETTLELGGLGVQLGVAWRW